MDELSKSEGGFLIIFVGELFHFEIGLKQFREKWWIVTR